jgi:hypothetical protein
MVALIVLAVFFLFFLIVLAKTIRVIPQSNGWAATRGRSLRACRW